MKQQLASNNLTTKTNNVVTKQKNLNDQICKLFVGGIPHNSTEAELQQYFEQFGPVSDVKIPKDPKRKRPKGYAFVTFFSPKAAESALLYKEHTLRGKKMGTKRAADPTQASEKTKNLQNSKLFAKGFPLETSEEKIYSLFEQKGPVDRVLMQFNSRSGEFRGFAYILMKRPSDFDKLIKMKILWLGEHKIELSASKSKEEVFKMRKEEGVFSKKKKRENNGTKRNEIFQNNLEDEQNTRDSGRNSPPPPITPIREQIQPPRMNITVYDDSYGVSSDDIANMRAGDHNLLWRPNRSRNGSSRSENRSLALAPRRNENFSPQESFFRNGGISRTYEIEKNEEVVILSSEEARRRTLNQFRPEIEVSQKIVTEFFYEGEDHKYKSIVEEKVHWSNNSSVYAEPGIGGRFWNA